MTTAPQDTSHISDIADVPDMSDMSDMSELSEPSDIPQAQKKITRLTTGYLLTLNLIP